MNELKRHVGALAGFSASTLLLAKEGTDRLSATQVAFFAMVAVANARGAPMTLTQVREAADEQLGKSIRNTYKVLLDTTHSHPTGLGWITRVTNPNDEREKYLVLTDEGLRVAKALALALTPISGQSN